ncbi:histidine kinase [Kitasatospora phosalacinea]|uniref:histidine kinase n=2 Tax=Kitasatospora phosalacinea TaxID=2065 RepID=A0A9W6PPJ1_9ACTN|nr:sensor histidine kinase [Kitasatospora phosalacinea]GLW58806.1 histidine kinase [Kitasatospora phosalacinea]
MNGSRTGRRVARMLTACGRGLVQALASQFAGVPLLVGSLLSVVFLPLGLGVLTTPLLLKGARAFADTERRWAREWSGVPIASPYRPLPRTEPGLIGRIELCRELLKDPATWRDLLWLLVNVPVGALLGVLPAALLVNGLGGLLVAPFLVAFTSAHHLYWTLNIPLGALCLAVAVFGAPLFVKAHALFCSVLLSPGRGQLTARVDSLTDSRSQVVDASAAELRRIERDLHDGAQARLVALGMNIGLAEQLIKHDPEAASQLMVEAREHSGQALSDLRDLVRGIHPPVLAERGLDGAVRALALTMPFPVDVRIELPGRPEAPVESAVYFAVAEALTNAAKHSGAGRAWAQLSHEDGRLVAIVGDDGMGGASASPGGGLAGVERRLAAFDGVLVVTSPAGGPTIITMELPCALSSPRT